MLKRLPKALAISVLFHILIVYFLHKQFVLPIPPKSQPTMKTYLVIEEPKTKVEPEAKVEPKQAEQAEQADENAVAEQTQVTSQAAVVQTEMIEAHQATEEIQVHDKNKNNLEKPRIDPFKALDNIRSGEHDYYSSPQSNNTAQSVGRFGNGRISTPKTHKEARESKDMPKMVYEGPTYRVFQKGAYCFKHNQIDPNNRSIDSSLPTTWRGLPYKCDKDKIEKAFDAAMEKWLPKKR
ncbi:cell envelope integrity protein TolA [Pseudoalteromonas phenolica]|uniref:cell envelope integrity protein TolA n=1 Tax=Pseudoalteromonas phenolica TaxID=161398 RepID=UPI00110A0E8E|nr:cell envelope integrity protein TolA [Pseudoalteromonas phenolica]